MNKNLKIGIFDSGVGGLTIMTAICKAMPSADVIYCSDNLNFPYGPKNADDVESCSINVATKLVELEEIDILVIACNTASTVALPAIREKLSIPVVGVVPAIKPAASLSESKVIGLLATPGTISRNYTKALINDFARDCEVIEIGSSELVELAERKIEGLHIDPLMIRDIVRNFKASTSIDTVILACTHFPLLIEELKQALPQIINWVDSADAVATRVEFLSKSIVIDPTSKPQHIVYFTMKNDNDSLLKVELRGSFNFSKILYLK